MARPDHSKPKVPPHPPVISREDIRALAHEALKELSKATSTDLAQRIGTEPSMVAIALASDARFTRVVDEQSVMRWTLVAAKAKDAPWPPRPATGFAKPLAPPTVIPLATAPSIVVEEIDPVRALQLLGMSRGNRQLRAKHVEWLAQQILDGCWRLTPATIAFSSSGRLLDGHHRLQAIVRAGKSVLTAVTYGWPDDAWDAIDCGVVRLVQDRFALITDSPAWNQRAVELIHAILRIEHSVRGKATNTQLHEAWKRFSGGIALVRKIFPVPDKRIQRTATLGALVRYYEQHPEHAVAFANQLSDPHLGDGIKPAQQLRWWLVRGEFVGGGYRGQRAVYWRSVAAMVAHRDGRLLTKLEPATSWKSPAAGAAAATEASDGR